MSNNIKENINNEVKNLQSNEKKISLEDYQIMSSLVLIRYKRKYYSLKIKFL